MTTTLTEQQKDLLHDHLGNVAYRVIEYIENKLARSVRRINEWSRVYFVQFTVGRPTFFSKKEVATRFAQPTLEANHKAPSNLYKVIETNIPHFKMMGRNCLCLTRDEMTGKPIAAFRVEYEQRYIFKTWAYKNGFKIYWNNTHKWWEIYMFSQGDLNKLVATPEFDKWTRYYQIFFTKHIHSQQINVALNSIAA